MSFFQKKFLLLVQLSLLISKSASQVTFQLNNEWFGPLEFDSFGSAIELVDLNDDNILDVIVGIPGYFLFDSQGQPLEESGSFQMSILDENFQVANIASLPNNPPSEIIAAGARVGTAVSVIGTSQGFVDWAIGAIGSQNVGQVHLFRWDISLQVNRYIDSISGATANDDFGSSIANLGDLNEDGFTDIAVGASLSDANIGDGYIEILYLDSAFQVLNRIRLSGMLPTPSGYGLSVSGADVNNDGIIDLISGIPFLDSESGGLEVALLSRENGPTTRLRFSNSDGGLEFGSFSTGELFGRAVSIFTDLDSNGVVDFFVGSPGGGETGILNLVQFSPTLNRLNRTTFSRGINLPDSLELGTNFSTALSPLRDINVDGAPDLFIGGPFDFQSPIIGQVYAFTASYCGDSILNSTLEECDDGNNRPGDGCSGLCEIEDGFICVIVSNPSVCRTLCGDGIVAGNEQCDDGNNVPGDGCGSDCMVEMAGSSFAHPFIPNQFLGAFLCILSLLYF